MNWNWIRNNELTKIWSDTLKPRGKYEMKRIAAFTAQWQTFVYLLIPLYEPSYKIDSFVVGILIAGGGWATEKLQQEKYKLNEPPPSDNNETIG